MLVDKPRDPAPLTQQQPVIKPPAPAQEEKKEPTSQPEQPLEVPAAIKQEDLETEDRKEEPALNSQANPVQQSAPSVPEPVLPQTVQGEASQPATAPIESPTIGYLSDFKFVF